MAGAAPADDQIASSADQSGDSQTDPGDFIGVDVAASPSAIVKKKQQRIQKDGCKQGPLLNTKLVKKGAIQAPRGKGRTRIFTGR